MRLLEICLLFEGVPPQRIIVIPAQAKIQEPDSRIPHG